MSIHDFGDRDTTHNRLLLLHLCTQLLEFCLLSYFKILLDLFALSALLVLEYVSGM